MKREWYVIFGITLSVAVWALFLSTSTVATIAITSLGCGFVSMFFLARSGIVLRRVRAGKMHDPYAFDMHRGCIALFTTFILIGVVCIEIVVRREHGLWGEGWLKSFHFTFVGLTIFTYLNVRFRFTGLMNPKIHRRLVYVFFLCYAATLTTGAMLLDERFSFLPPH